MKKANVGTWLALLVLGCAEPTGAADLASAEPDLPASVQAELRAGGPADAHGWDRVHTLDHYVPVGPGRWIHVREGFTLRAWFRHERRAVLMLPGPIVTGEFYEIPVDGYRGRSILAEEGAFVFTADFEGTGESSMPADGRSPTQDLQVEAMRTVLRYIRLVRGVRQVDVLGESWGGGVAAELCADTRRVRSCVLASMLYRTASPFADATFRSPGFLALLDSLPDGYLPTAPETYLGLTFAMPPDVAAWTLAEMPGVYTIVPLQDVFDLPFFDATVARAPGLLVQGELDPNQSLDDSRELVHDYGGSMSLVVIPSGGHIPRTEPAPANDLWWAAVLDFLAL